MSPCVGSSSGAESGAAPSEHAAVGSDSTCDMLPDLVWHTAALSSDLGPGVSIHASSGHDPDHPCKQDCGAADPQRRPEWAPREAAGRVLQLVVPLGARHPGPPALDRRGRAHPLHPVLPGARSQHDWHPVSQMLSAATAESGFKSFSTFAVAATALPRDAHAGFAKPTLRRVSRRTSTMAASRTDLRTQ